MNVSKFTVQSTTCPGYYIVPSNRGLNQRRSGNFLLDILTSGNSFLDILYQVSSLVMARREQLGSNRHSPTGEKQERTSLVDHHAGIIVSLSWSREGENRDTKLRRIDLASERTETRNSYNDKVPVSRSKVFNVVLGGRYVTV